MKHRIRVTLAAECQVEIDVDVAEGDDPTDLTAGERDAAEDQGDSFPRWEFVRAELIKDP